MTLSNTVGPGVSAIAPWASAEAQGRLADLEAQHQETTAAAVRRAVAVQVAKHHARMASGVTLYAGTNILSPAVTAAHYNGLVTRPALGWPGEKVQTATQEIEHLEVMAAQQVARSLRARFAEVRFLTATMANLATYAAFARPGDTIAVLSPEAGGHASHQGELGTAGLAGLRVTHLPYEPAAFDVHAGRLIGFLREVQPRIVLIGGSVTLFPHDLGMIREAADSVGAVVVYDASHTAGLIAAGHFQDPLAEGAHVVTFSTYKTYAGPAGGASVTNDPECAQRLADVAYPRLLSNYDPARIGPLAIAAAETVEQAPAWAIPTVQLAQQLAAELHARGLTVLGEQRGYTRTHQVVIDVSSFGGGTPVMRQLENLRIYTGACRLPYQPSGSPPAGIRLGTQELVRRGATAHVAADLAELIHSALTQPQNTRLPALRERLWAYTETDLWGRRQLDNRV